MMCTFRVGLGSWVSLARVRGIVFGEVARSDDRDCGL